MSQVHNPLVKAFPLEIDPSAHWPATARAEVRRGMEERYPCQIWSYRGKVVWLDLDTGTISPLSLRRFRALSPRAVVYVQERGRGEGRHQARIEVPTRVLDDVYEGPGWPELISVRRCPWVAADGRLVAEPGYDEQTGIYLHWVDDPCDPDGVTQADVEDVLSRLTDFAFAGLADQVAYMALLLQLVRVLVGNPAPLGLITALEAESAKTLVARIIGLLALGVPPSPSKLPKSETEQHYTIDAYVREEPPILWLDNVATGATLGGSDLHAILTATEDVASRVVGTGAIGRGNPTRIQWLATGNQIEVDAELARRVLPVQLRVRPSDRPFRTANIERWVLDNRRLVLSVLLRLVLDWHRAGQPEPVRILPSFEGWSRLVGGPVCLVPKAAEVWLSASSRPVPQIDRDLAALCASWPLDKRGHVQPLPGAMVFALALTLDLSGLDERLGPGSDVTRQRRMAAFLRERSQQQRPTLGWRLVRQMQGNNPLYLPLAYVGGGSGGSSGAGSGGRSGDGGGSGQKETGGPREPESPEPPEVWAAGVWETEDTLCLPPSVAPHVQSPNSSGDSGDSGTPPKNYTIQPEADRSGGSGDRSQGGYPLGEAGAVHIPREDVAYDAIIAMASRGLRVDPDLWLARAEAAEAAFGASGTREDADRLKNLRSYKGPVYLQAATGARVRCSWELQGPGRVGTVKPSLHQITKAHGMRTPILPEAGHVFVVGDWRAAHVWIAAGASRDERMLEELSAGHLYERAAEVWQTTADRAKVCALATLNGAGPGRLAEILADGTSEGDAKRRRDRWLGTYPTMRATLRRWHGRRTWRSPLGRLVAMPADRDDYSAVGWSLQAIEADALRLVLRHVAEDVVLTVHDEVVLEVPEAEAARAGSYLRDHMDGALRELADLRDMDGDTVRVEVRRAWRES